MRFRTITARSMEAAMAELRVALGPDAIILNSETAADGKVTLRAAVEPSPVNGYGVNTGDSIADAIECALNFHRTPEPIIFALLDALDSAPGDPVQALAAALSARYGFAPLPLLPTRPVMLIGPAGAGKTLTAARIAARTILAGHQMSLITTDLVRAGGAEQLEAYARTMKAPCFRATHAAELAAIAGTCVETGACIIDTTGTSPYNIDELTSLKNFVMAVDCDPVLVLPASGDAMETCEIANIFSGLGARGMIVTRLDATRRIGCILGALESAAMILHDAGVSPFLANGLAPVTPQVLARLILDGAAINDTAAQLEQAVQ